MGIRVELQAVVGHDHIDAVAFQRQLVAVANQAQPVTLDRAGVDMVADGAALDQRYTAHRTQLQDVIAESDIQVGLQCAAGMVQQVLTPLPPHTRIPVG